MRRRLRHPFRLVSRAIVLKWAWQNRHDLMRWGRFAMRLPSELRTRELDDLVTEARARIALSADPRTRLAGDLDICGYDNGSLIVRAHGEKPVAQVARDLLADVSGITDVRVVDPDLPTTSAAYPSSTADDTLSQPRPTGS